MPFDQLDIATPLYTAMQFSQKCSMAFQVRTKPPIHGHELSFPGVKRPGCEVGHHSPCSAKVKSKWRYTSAPSIYLQNVDRDNFTFFYLYNETNYRLAQIV